MQIFNDVQQGSDAWRTLRCGLPTASGFKHILASGKGGGPSLTRSEYLRKLAGEILTGEPAESYSNAHMERGNALEPEARDLYAMLTDTEPQIVGFIRDGRKGCSPDSLINSDGALEIKTALPHILIEKLEKPDHFPPEHKAQTQGNLWIARRDWIDIAVYCRPSMPMFILRAYRDEAYIQKLATEVDRFNDELAELVEKIRAMGTRVAA